MMRAVFAAVSGTVFGVGLAVSQMMNPARVLGFFDVFGTWDPTLLFVMAGALTVAIPGFVLSKKLSRPLDGSEFSVQPQAAVTPRLIAGSVIFGVGWGIVGLCPGPAFAGLALLRPESWIYFAAMAVGMTLGIGYNRRRS